MATSLTAFRQPSLATPPVLRFYRMVESARAPQRADRSAAGTLPTRASRFCDAVTQAAGFGWHVYAPLDISLLWDGDDIYWHYAELDDWLRLDAAQFPHLASRFDSLAPPEMQGCAPPFLTALAEPGLVQVWTGLIARTAPDWSLLVRAPANLPGPGGFAVYEGIVETDRWFGPLFTNLRLTRTDTPISLRVDIPLLQVQALPRAVYAEETQGAVPDPTELAGFTAADWADYNTSVVAPNMMADRPVGLYAIAARRRRRAGCPHAAAAPA